MIPKIFKNWPYFSTKFGLFFKLFLGKFEKINDEPDFLKIIFSENNPIDYLNSF